MVLIINIPHSDATIKVSHANGQTRITPEDFNYNDPFQAKALATVVDMVKNGSLMIPETEKSALVSIPAGQSQSMQGTQPPAAAPDTQEAVSLQQLLQMVKDLQGQVVELQQDRGAQAQPAPPPEAMPPGAAAPPAVPPAPAQGLAGG